MRLRCAGAGVKPCRAWGSVRPENRGERFPADWQDPLELYGGLRGELAGPHLDPASERVQAGEWIRKHGAHWVWSNRHRLVSLRKFVAGTAVAGNRQQPSGSRGAGACPGA